MLVLRAKAGASALQQRSLQTGVQAFCNGKRTLADIIDLLAEKYVAEREAIATVVTALLQDLADRGFLINAREEE